MNNTVWHLDKHTHFLSTSIRINSNSSLIQNTPNIQSNWEIGYYSNAPIHNYEKHKKNFVELSDVNCQI